MRKQIIAVAALKGGVGKTTLAVNLACALAAPRRPAVVIDADSQGSATAWSQRGELPARVVPLPLESPREAAGWSRRVLDVDAAFVVIDCPPHLGPVLAAAIGSADAVLIPVGPSVLDLEATGPTLELVKQAQAARRGDGPRAWIVPCRVDERTLSGRELAAAVAGLGCPVAPAVHLRVALADAVAAGHWAGSYEPGGAAHQEIARIAQLVRRSPT